MNAKKLKEQLNGKLQSPQSETAEEPDTTALTTVSNSNFIALTSDALGIINENLKNQQLSPALFDVVKSPSGGTTVFTVPGLNGDEVHKELSGIVLEYTTPRAYWATQEPKEGEPPECWSRDSIVSFDGKPCNACPYNDFGSKNGGETNAKACKEQVGIFLLRQDNILPLVVRVPVSSKNTFLKYATRLVGSLKPLHSVVTKISLEKSTSKTGQAYARYIFEAVNKLTDEEAVTVRDYGQRFMGILNTVSEHELNEAV